MNRDDFEAHIAAIKTALPQNGDLSPTLALSIVQAELHKLLEEVVDLRAFKRGVLELVAPGAVVLLTASKPSTPRGLSLVKPEGGA